MQNELIDKGRLQINVVNNFNIPINNATINISYSGEPDRTIESLTTNSSGSSPVVDLNAPPIELSLDETNIIQPYSEYSIYVTAPGYEPVDISGIEILSDTTSVQSVNLIPLEEGAPSDIVIPAHTLYGEYPAKIPEAEIKPVNESGEIVLSRVVVPETVVVHDGSPSDSTAPNYYVNYTDYIKNVASSEIYATWPESTITANVLAIMSFTLNRVYTEWYRNKGYNFTITSSTAYDHKWIYGRNIFNSISTIVDEIFDQYLARPNVKQPILTQYCDGKRVTCPNWMSQWGSKDLGDRGYSAIEIIRNYYGNSMYIRTAELISGIPSSWPGYNLTVGSTGDKVRQMQEQLNRIAQVYTSIPQIAVDGIFGENTRRAVEQFQSVFGLARDGIVGFKTWYKISQIYVGITRIAELN
ncbi:MAG: peptidoglycan-binding protein [Lachnospiraceae bacterium]|nr:peptidoglycan-binding protein [Lachnospiraceae bacterium]MCI8826940.1 peptidoglycan-binding protein [Lachnospiraceae bacterium]MCI9369034.1 peptidoglycan-binding protein [Lachnospiraceae bacterium]MDE7307501.1 peptidoglycan-binding protein [Lachnospiraceae bacterium]